MYRSQCFRLKWPKVKPLHVASCWIILVARIRSATVRFPDTKATTYLNVDVISRRNLVQSYKESLALISAMLVFQTFWLAARKHWTNQSAPNQCSINLKRKLSSKDHARIYFTVWSGENVKSFLQQIVTIRNRLFWNFYLAILKLDTLSDSFSLSNSHHEAVNHK